MTKEASIIKLVAEMLDDQEIKDGLIEWLNDNHGDISKIHVAWVSKKDKGLRTFAYNCSIVEVLGIFDLCRDLAKDQLYESDEEDDDDGLDIGKCEIKTCGRVVSKLLYVNENVGDGSWRIGICQACADKLGVKEGDELK